MGMYRSNLFKLHVQILSHLSSCKILILSKFFFLFSDFKEEFLEYSTHYYVFLKFLISSYPITHLFIFAQIRIKLVIQSCQPFYWVKNLWLIIFLECTRLPSLKWSKNGLGGNQCASPKGDKSGTRICRNPNWRWLFPRFSFSKSGVFHRRWIKKKKRWEESMNEKRGRG